MTSFLNWRSQKILEEQANGQKLWFGFPENWLESPVWWVCENGHVSNWYIKSEEHGYDKCTSCEKRVYISPKISEDELREILDGKFAEPV